ncbi:rhomboid family intramembrane serine protease [Apibacter raozihei]|uniref:rhomboid family intramembrane serine protease n=1 Tax=Apibacter raozihei TaxID=2500547 RepID=UPI000FE36DD9|nr:rhomboid family intramembrane serine protease [Apibacter raozihei]
MNEFLNKWIQIYKSGSEGIKFIYISVISTVVFGIFNFLLFSGFNISIEKYILLSYNSVFPFLWTFVTFIFVNLNFLDLALTMIMIYFVEKIFRMFFNGESFIKFFFLGSFAGALAFILCSFLSGFRSQYLQGATLGIYSVLLAVISYNPKMKVSLFPLPVQFPIYILGMIIIGLDLITAWSHSETLPLIIARLAAAGFGYFYMKFYQAGNDFLGFIIPDRNKWESWKKIFISRPKSKFKAEPGGNTYSKRPKSDEEYSMDKLDKQKKINQILDKISQSGYESLTREEKDFLFKASR